MAICTYPAIPDTVDAALARGDVPAALALARGALAAGIDDPFLVNLTAWDDARNGAPAAAEARVRSELMRCPGDPGLMTTLGFSLRLQGRLAEALSSLDAALRLAPDYAVAWLERAVTLHQGNSLRVAAESFRRAVALDPGCAPGWGGLARVLLALGDRAAARTAAVRALAIDGADPGGTLALAACEIAAGDAAAAIARLQPVITADRWPRDLASIAETLLGDAWAALGKPAAAVSAWSAAKRDLVERFPQLAARRESATQIAERLAGELRHGLTIG